MSFTFNQKLPVPKEIKEQYPVSEKLAAIKAGRDKELIDVISGASDKFLVIIGPCSADNEEAVCDYISRLKRVQEKVADKVICVPRIYTNKPRTTGEGYKGMLHQPDPEKAPDLFGKAGPSCICGACSEGKMCCGRADEVRARHRKLMEGCGHE